MNSLKRSSWKAYTTTKGRFMNFYPKIFHVHSLLTFAVVHENRLKKIRIFKEL